MGVPGAKREAPPVEKALPAEGIRFLDIASYESGATASRASGCWLIALTGNRKEMLFMLMGEGDTLPQSIDTTHGNAVLLPSSILSRTGYPEECCASMHSGESQLLSLDEQEYNQLRRYFSLIRRSLQEVSQDRPNDETLYLGVAMLMYCQSLLAARGQKPDHSRQALIANRFIRLVNENCEKERNMEFYARSLSVAPKYLSSIISTKTGKTASEWIKEYTISKARAYLKNTGLTINEISDQMNFITSSDFAKYFRRNVGLSPKEFRNAYLTTENQSYHENSSGL